MLQLLASLSARHPDFVLLHRGAHGALGEWRGDIDLLAMEDEGEFLRSVRATAAELGFSPVLQVQRVFSTLEIALLFPGARSWTAVFVDEHGAALHLDIAFTTPALLMTAGRSPGADPAEAGGEAMASYLLLKRLRKGDDRTASWSRIAECGSISHHLLKRLFHPPVATGLAEAARLGDPPAPELFHDARRALRRSRVLSATGLREGIQGVRVAASRIRTPGGAFVALAGVDGVGKSAIADALAAWSPFRHTRRLHSRPELLKPPGWFLGRRPGTGAQPHEPEPWGRAVSALRLAYFWTDFVLGYWVRIWPWRARGGLVISERWWWDMYVDPRRHRLQPMRTATRLLGALVPAADASFVLDAPSAVVRERKQELPASEIERQREAWERVAPAIDHLITVDAARALPEVSAAVIAGVVERQRQRIAPSREWRAFPARNPRWLVDPCDRGAIAAALRLYLPSRRSVLLGLRALDLLCRHTAFGAPLLRRISSAQPEPALVAEALTEAAIRHAPGDPAGFRMTAYLGSPGPTRKTSAVVCDATGRPVLFAKVASTPAASRVLANEAEVLARLDSIIPGVEHPRVVAFEQAPTGARLLLSPVSGVRLGNRTPPDSRHLEFLGQLAAVRVPLDGAAHHAGLRARLTRLPSGRFSGVLQRALDATAAPAGALRWAHFAHGDFTPWNCLDSTAGLGVVDWEMAGHRLPGWDAVHYVTQIEAITRTGSVPQAANRLLGASFLARVGALVLGTDAPEAHKSDLWRSLQVLVLTESAIELLEYQPRLSDRGVSVRAHAIARLLDISPPGGAN